MKPGLTLLPTTLNNYVEQNHFASKPFILLLYFSSETYHNTNTQKLNFTKNSNDAEENECGGNKEQRFKIQRVIISN